MLTPLVPKAILAYLKTFGKTLGRLQVFFAFIVNLCLEGLLSTAEFTQHNHY